MTARQLRSLAAHLRREAHEFECRAVGPVSGLRAAEVADLYDRADKVSP